jgi:hypothetical protein
VDTAAIERRSLIPHEKRAHPRANVNTAGVAIFNGRDVPVMLRNISEGGACLRSMSGASLPETFLLSVPLEQIKVVCEVRWRRGRDLGVRFKT